MTCEIPWEKAATGARLLCQSIIAKCAIFSEAADVETAHLCNPSTRGRAWVRKEAFALHAPRAPGRRMVFAHGNVLASWAKT